MAERSSSHPEKGAREPSLTRLVGPGSSGSELVARRERGLWSPALERVVRVAGIHVDTSHVYRTTKTCIITATEASNPSSHRAAPRKSHWADV
jgi:hypothetical protein